MKKIVTAALVLAALGSAALAGPIEDRQALMKQMAATAKDASGFARGATPWDAAAVKAKMQTLADDSTKLPSLFPAGSDKGDTKTTAAPAIWSDAAGFKAAATKLATDAKAAGAAADATAFAAAFKMVQADCGACHQTYRVK